MVTNSFGNKCFMQSIRSLIMHSWGVQFSFLNRKAVGGGGCVWVPCSQCVHIRFPKAPQVVPQEVPNSTSHVSHMVCPKFFSCSIKWKGGLYASIFASILGLGFQKRYFYRGSVQCSKNNWWWANQCGCFKKKKKRGYINEVNQLIINSPWTY